MTPTEIIIHHSLTKDSGTVSWGAIRKYHTDPKPVGMGMTSIGYHLGIELVQSGDNFYYESLMGRVWDAEGGHTIGHNDKSLGICFVGNYDLVVPSEEMLITGAKVIRLWMRLFNIQMDSIFPHRDFADKTCPGTKFDMNVLKDFI
jgi:hypothetical protein